MRKISTWLRVSGSSRGVLSVLFCVLVTPIALAQGSGDYTKGQAEQGASVFASHCAECHGAQLHGEAGPALAGTSFKESLEFSKMSANQLFQFISTQMPRSDPGSLSQDQYFNVLAFILSKNGYPAGTEKLSKQLLSHVKLLPYPDSTKTQ